MAGPTRYPALSLEPGDERVIKLRPDEVQATALRYARRAVDEQLARAVARATSDRERRALERRVISVAPKGKRSIVIRREADAKAARAAKKAA